MPPLPASAAGPELRHLFLGSEGRFGILTRAVLRVRPKPEIDTFRAIVFKDWELGVAAVREIAQARVAVSMLRLSDALESETTLRLAELTRIIDPAKRFLGLAGFGADRCLLICGLTGDKLKAALAWREIAVIAGAHGGLAIPIFVGEMWRRNRFRAPYLRNTLWDLGYATDTLETAVPWSAVTATAEAIKSILESGLEACDERVFAFSHLSHVYADGASIYVTYLFRRSPQPDETLHRWRMLKTAASLVVVGQGGTISHQHGVGIDHAPYLIAEKGAVGLQMLQAVQRALDPEGLLNPGKLFDTA